MKTAVNFSGTEENLLKHIVHMGIETSIDLQTLSIPSWILCRQFLIQGLSFSDVIGEQ